MSRFCALSNASAILCWGYNGSGQLGVGHTSAIGNRCAVDTAYNLRCWGRNGQGQLGYGHTSVVGDNEHPVSAGPVPY